MVRWKEKIRFLPCTFFLLPLPTLLAKRNAGIRSRGGPATGIVSGGWGRMKYEGKDAINHLTFWMRDRIYTLKRVVFIHPSVRLRSFRENNRSADFCNHHYFFSSSLRLLPPPLFLLPLLLFRLLPLHREGRIAHGLFLSILMADDSYFPGSKSDGGAFDITKE